MITWFYNLPFILFLLLLKGKVKAIGGNKNVSEESFYLEKSFMLYARDLPDQLDYFAHKPDPYVVFYKHDGSHNGKWEWISRTETVVDTTRPNWDKVMVDRHVKLNVGQKWKFFVFDYDPLDEDDFIGDVTVSVDEFIKSSYTFLPKKIQPGPAGYLVLSTDFQYLINNSEQMINKLTTL